MPKYDQADMARLTQHAATQHCQNNELKVDGPIKPHLVSVSEPRPSVQTLAQIILEELNKPSFLDKLINKTQLEAFSILVPIYIDEPENNHPLHWSLLHIIYQSTHKTCFVMHYNAQSDTNTAIETLRTRYQSEQSSLRTKLAVKTKFEPLDFPLRGQNGACIIVEIVERILKDGLNQHNQLLTSRELTKRIWDQSESTAAFEHELEQRHDQSRRPIHSPKPDTVSSLGARVADDATESNRHPRDIKRVQRFFSSALVLPPVIDDAESDASTPKTAPPRTDSPSSASADEATSAASDRSSPAP